MNIHDEWLESFNRPRDRGISFFKKYYSYQLLDKTIYPKGIKAILLYQYPFLKDNQELLQGCIKCCNGSYTNNGPKVREFIYNRYIKFDKKRKD